MTLKNYSTYFGNRLNEGSSPTFRLIQTHVKRQTKREKKTQRQSSQAKTKQATKAPRQSLEVGRVTPAPAQMWGRKPCQQGEAECALAWGQPSLYFSALPVWVPCPSTTGSKVLSVPAWALAQGPTTCTESCWNFALPRAVGIYSLSGAGRISPHGHTPAPGCICMWVFLCIHTKYLQEGHLLYLNIFLQLHIAWSCHSLSQLNGVKELFLLPTAAITIRVGGRGNEHAAHTVPSSHQLLLRARCSRQSGSKAWGGKQV